MRNINLKKFLPYIVVIFSFGILSSIFFSPALEGYVVQSHDMDSHAGMAKEVKDYRLIYQEEPFWSSTMFSGMPSYLFASSNGQYIAEWIKKIMTLGLPYPISLLLLYFLGFFILMKCLKINTWLSLIGSIAFGLSTYSIIIIPAGHVIKGFAIAFMPMVVGTFMNVFRSKHLFISIPLFALALALQISCSHHQITYYTAFIVIALGIGELVYSIKNKRISGFLGKSGLLIVATIVAVLANFSNLYTTYEYSHHTIRGEKLLSKENLFLNTPEHNSNNEKESINASKGLDRDYIVGWSMGKEELSVMMLADAKGGVSGAIGAIPHMDKKLKSETSGQMYQSLRQSFSSYWGNQPGVSGPVYLGCIIVFLALLGIYFIRSHIKWALVGVSILAILLSLGDNLGGSIENMWLTNFFIDYIPMYAKFRVVAMTLVIVQLTAPLLALMFINDLVTNKEKYLERKKELLIVAGSIAAIILIFFVMLPSAWYSFLSNNEMASYKPEYANIFNGIESFRKSVLSAEALRAILFIALTFGAILLFLNNKKSSPNKLIPILGISIAVLVLIDMWNVDRRYVSINKNIGGGKTNKYKGWVAKHNYTQPVSPSQADNFILNNEIKNNPYYAEKHASFVDKYNKKNKDTPQYAKKIAIENLKYSALNFTSNYRVLTMNNPFNNSMVSYLHKTIGGYHAAKLRRYQDVITNYLGSEIQEFNTPNGLAKAKFLNMLNMKYIMTQPNAAPIINPYRMGNAWFVNNIKFVDSNDDEIVGVSKIDVKTTAVVHNEFKDVFKNNSYTIDSSATIKLDLESYKSTHLTYKTKSNNDMPAVFSEIYYEDGWNAYIDGEKVDYARCNYVLRMLPIPAGEHTVEFKFEPMGVKIYNTITVIATLLILLCLGFGAFLKFKKNGFK